MATTSNNTELKTFEELETMIDIADKAIWECLAGDGDVVQLMKKIKKNVVNFKLLSVLISANQI